MLWHPLRHPQKARRLRSSLRCQTQHPLVWLAQNALEACVQFFVPIHRSDLWIWSAVCNWNDGRRLDCEPGLFAAAGLQNLIPTSGLRPWLQKTQTAKTDGACWAAIADQLLCFYAGSAVNHAAKAGCRSPNVWTPLAHASGVLCVKVACRAMARWSCDLETAKAALLASSAKAFRGLALCPKQPCVFPPIW